MLIFLEFLNFNDKSYFSKVNFDDFFVSISRQSNMMIFCQIFIEFLLNCQFSINLKYIFEYWVNFRLICPFVRFFFWFQPASISRQSNMMIFCWIFIKLSDWHQSDVPICNVSRFWSDFWPIFHMSDFFDFDQWRKDKKRKKSFF